MEASRKAIRFLALLYNAVNYRYVKITASAQKEKRERKKKKKKSVNIILPLKAKRMSGEKLI